MIKTIVKNTCSRETSVSEMEKIIDAVNRRRYLLDTNNFHELEVKKLFEPLVET